MNSRRSWCLPGSDIAREPESNGLLVGIGFWRQGDPTVGAAFFLKAGVGDIKVEGIENNFAGGLENLEVNQHGAVRGELFEIRLEMDGVVFGDNGFGEFAGRGGERKRGFGACEGSDCRLKQQNQQEQAVKARRHFQTIGERWAGVNNGEEKPKEERNGEVEYSGTVFLANGRD